MESPPTWAYPWARTPRVQVGQALCVTHEHTRRLCAPAQRPPVPHLQGGHSSALSWIWGVRGPQRLQIRMLAPHIAILVKQDVLIVSLNFDLMLGDVLRATCSGGKKHKQAAAGWHE